MLRPHLRLRPRDLVIDFFFVAWLAYVIVAGRLLPDQVVALFRHEPPTVVQTEQPEGPGPDSLISIVSLAEPV